MCGIAGRFNFDSHHAVDPQRLRAMTGILAHRGPDAEGFHVGRGIGLGHRRLSVIDLSTGDQPLANEDHTVWVVFNGEIYNFAEIRSELQRHGHRFRTTGDTEVIVHAYEQWGTQSVERFRGMFAYALWDDAARRLLLVRDRIGVKPLYYSASGTGITFGSEIKALLEDPDVPRDWSAEAVDAYLALQYVPCPQTIFKGISKLPAGHFLVAEPGRIEVRRYWDLAFTGDGDPGREAEYLDRLESLVNESVRLRLVSDVPLGAFLSGGIDSTAVVAAMVDAGSQRVITTSVGFDEEAYDELAYALGRDPSGHGPARAHRPVRHRRSAAGPRLAFRRAVRRFLSCSDVLRVPGSPRARDGRVVGGWRRRTVGRVRAPPGRTMGGHRATLARPERQSPRRGARVASAARCEGCAVAPTSRPGAG
jgi:asparagine synthase (glutamine-hydrolysing)